MYMVREALTFEPGLVNGSRCLPCERSIQVLADVHIGCMFMCCNCILFNFKMDKEGPSGVNEGASRTRGLKRRQPIDEDEDELVSGEESDDTRVDGKKKKGGTG